MKKLSQKIEAYGYKYNNKDQRIVWRKVFPSNDALNKWADSQNATVIGTRTIGPSDPGFSNPKYMKEEHEPAWPLTGDTADKLSVGDRVMVTDKNNTFYRITGTIDSFDSSKAFVVVNLNKYGKRSFHSSDVSEILDDMDDVHISPDGDEIDEFYVTFYTERGDVPEYWVGKVAMQGSKWREYSFKGKPEYRWGQTYMGYLTPYQVVDWINKDYSRSYQVGGPFFTMEDLNNEVEQYYEAKLKESVSSNNSFKLLNNLLESKKKFDVSKSKYEIKTSGSDVNFSCDGEKLFTLSNHEWKDLIDAVRNRTTGNFGGFVLHQLGDSFVIKDSSGKQVAYISAPEMDYLISRTYELLKEEIEYNNFDAWKRAVLDEYPTLANKIRFKGRVEKNKMLISAEIPGQDRSYGVWDQDAGNGVVLK
jgi:uncharacterized protein YxjI